MEYNQQLAEDLWTALENVELDMSVEFVESFVKPNQAPSTIDVKPLMLVAGEESCSPTVSPGASVPPSPSFTDYSDYATPEEEVKPIVDDLMWLSQSLDTKELQNLTPEQTIEALASNFRDAASSDDRRRVAAAVMAGQQTAPGGGAQRPVAPGGGASSLSSHTGRSATSNSRSRSNKYGPPGSINGLLDLDEESLVNLPVRDLNKRLQGCSRDEIVKIKQKRRTLKNRGYAQNCRTKRMMQRSELEQENRSLMIELSKLKADIAGMARERDMYRTQYENLRRRNASESTLPSSPESVFMTS